MPTMPYYNAAGERLPGVTYVIGQNLGWNKDALKFWGNREGLAGRNLRDRDNYGQRAADIGTAAHTMIEAHCQGWDPEEAAADQMAALPAEDRTKAMRGFGSFLRWYGQTKLQVLGTELWGVNEEYQTGYCLDVLFRDVDGLALGDWKSSSGTFPDHFIQAAAYTHFEEARLSGWVGEPVRFVGAYVLRVDKENGMFSYKFWPRDILEDGWRVFTWLRAIHQYKWPLERYMK